MAAALDDTALLQYHDHVRVHNGGQTVGDDEHRAALHQLIHTPLDNGFGAGVDGGGSLVQNQAGRVGNRRTGDGDELALTLGEVGAVVGEQRVVTLRQTGDEIVRARQSGRLAALVVGGLQIAVADVVHHRAGEEVGLLQHDAQRAAQVRLANLVDVDAVVPHLTVRDVVEAVDEVGDGGLACAGGAHEGHLLTRLGVYRHVVEDGLALFVGKVHLGEAHVTLQQGIGEGAVSVGMLPRPAAGVAVGFGDGAVLRHDGVDQRHVAVVHLGLLVHQLKQTLGTRQTHGDVVDLLGHLIDVAGELLGHIEERHHDGDGEGQPRQTEVGHAQHQEQAADHGAGHVQHVTDVHNDGAEAVGEGVGLKTVLV